MKVIAKNPSTNETYHKYLESLLEQKDSTISNSIDGHEWKFNMKDKVFLVNFTDLEQLIGDSTHTIEFLTEQGDTLHLRPIELAKALFLELTISDSIGSLQRATKFIIQIFSYWHQYHYQPIDTKHLQSMFQHIMMTNLTKEGLSLRRTPYSYAMVFGWGGPDKLKKMSSANRFELFSRMSKPNWEQAFSNAILECTDMSVADYQKGGSFNFLTLDIGKYYIDHNISLFNKYHLTVLSIDSVRDDAEEIAIKTGLSLLYVTQGIDKVLDGMSLEEIQQYQESPMGRGTFNSIKKLVDSGFKKHYKKYFTTDCLFSYEAITAIAMQLELIPNSATICYLQSLLLNNTHKNGKELTERRVTDLSNSLHYQKENTKDTFRIVTPESFNKACESVKKEMVSNLKIPKLTKLYYKNSGVEFSERLDPYGNGQREKVISYNKQLTRAIMHMGATAFVSYTGWRETEFGFPYKSLEMTENPDITDSPYYPIRFQVFGEVPKTNGETRLKREITVTSALLMHRLYNLSGSSPNSDNPCLYSTNGNSSKHAKSSAYIKKAVRANWTGFVVNYQPFVDVRRLEELKDLNGNNVLTDSQREQLIRLSEQYNNKPQLLDVANRVHSELPRLNATSYLYSYSQRKSTKRKSAKRNGASEENYVGNQLADYINKELPNETMAMWDEYLTPDLKDAIKGLDFGKKQSQDMTKDINNCLMKGIAYPTPHAFRHIWAEAVYRRFEGDIGALIRQNFQHIGNQFYKAYLRDKDNEFVDQRAKSSAISSIVKKHITSSGKASVNYGGKLNQYLKALAKSTDILNAEDLDQGIEEFAEQEMLDIKSNSWGYCILQVKAMHKAKCAVNGVPQRHNASPSFCVGCDNNLIEDGHLVGLMLSIENDLEIIASPDTPKYFKEPSLYVVVKVKKELESMFSETKDEEIAEYITYLESALTSTMEAA